MENVVFDRNATHHVTPRTGVLIYYIGSKLGYTDEWLSGRRQNFKNQINWIYSKGANMHILNKIAEILVNKRLPYSYSTKRDHCHDKCASNRNENATLLRWKAFILVP